MSAHNILPMIPRPCAGCGASEAQMHADDCPTLREAVERAGIGYRATFRTNIEVVVQVRFPDEDVAVDAAWEVAEEFLQTLGTKTGDHRIVSVEASLDGIGADEVEAIR